MKGLNGKKGLILIALMIAAMLGAYAAQYYTWTASYTVIKLTDSFAIPITATSGATQGSFDDFVKDDFIVVTTPLDKIGFGVHSWVMTAGDPAEVDVKEAYYELIVTIEVATSDGVVDSYSDGLEIGEVVICILDGGFLSGCPHELFIDPTDPIAVGDYDVRISVTYWTGAVDADFVSTQPIDVWAVE